MLKHIENSDIKKVKKLINKGVDINKLYDYGLTEYTALMWASYYEEFEIIKYLVESGADINFRNHTNSSALIKASMNDKFKTIKYLIHKGADINVFDTHGRSAIGEACYGGCFKIIKYLICCGADLNLHMTNLQSDIYWSTICTPFIRACVCINIKIIKYMLKNNAAINPYKNSFKFYRGYTINTDYFKIIIFKRIKIN